MAALQSTAPPYRHTLGDLVFRFFTLSGANGDTILTPGGNILLAEVQPTTAISVGTTVNGSTVTFVTGGAWAGTLLVISRTG